MHLGTCEAETSTMQFLDDYLRHRSHQSSASQVVSNFLQVAHQLLCSPAQLHPARPYFDQPLAHACPA